MGRNPMGWGLQLTKNKKYVRSRASRSQLSRCQRSG
jgi:hypothetical protein